MTMFRLKYSTLEFWRVFLLSISLVTGAFGQESTSTLPDDPLTVVSSHKPAIRFTMLEKSLFAADASAQAMDVYSTHRDTNRYSTENILPDAIASHWPVMTAYEGLRMATVIESSRLLDKHHHHRLALLVPAIDCAATSFTVWGNMQITQGHKGMRRLP